MIEKVINNKEAIVNSKTTSLYKMIAIVMILEKYDKMGIGKLQIYLWGLENHNNRQQLIDWKRTKRITDMPSIIDIELMPIISQCILNNLIRTVTKSNKTDLTLNINAAHFLAQIHDSDLYSEIDADLIEIGQFANKIIEDIQFDF